MVVWTEATVGSSVVAGAGVIARALVAAWGVFGSDERLAPKIGCEIR